MTSGEAGEHTARFTGSPFRHRPGCAVEGPQALATASILLVLPAVDGDRVVRYQYSVFRKGSALTRWPLCHSDPKESGDAQGTHGTAGAGLRGAGIPVADPGHEHGARRGVPTEIRGPGGPLPQRHEEDEDEIAPPLPVGARHRRGSPYAGYLRRPDRPQYPLLEHGLAREEGRRADDRGLAPGLRVRLAGPGGARRLGPLRVRGGPGMPVGHSRVAQSGGTSSTRRATIRRAFSPAVSTSRIPSTNRRRWTSSSSPARW